MRYGSKLASRFFIATALLAGLSLPAALRAAPPAETAANAQAPTGDAKSSDKSADAKPAEAAAEKPAEKPAEKKAAKAKAKKKAKGGAVSDSTHPQVTFETSMGSFTVELWPDKAPETVKNILKYVDDGFYAGTIFHRVIDGFMIQGGGFTPTMEQKKTRGPVKLEASPEVRNLRGTVAMARTNDPDSATAQFFVNVKDNASLDRRGAVPGGYTVFGKVVDGMDVIDQIKAVKTTSKGMYDDVPATTIEIKSAKRK